MKVDTETCPNCGSGWLDHLDCGAYCNDCNQDLWYDDETGFDLDSVQCGRCGDIGKINVNSNGDAYCYQCDFNA